MAATHGAPSDGDGGESPMVTAARSDRDPRDNSPTRSDVRMGR